MPVLSISLAASAEDYRFSGPYTHDNLSIFLIHGPQRQPTSTFLTLQEALDQKKVVVYETGNVNQLAIENFSGEDVYIQSGDIVKGGQQDRVFPDDFVLPKTSGRSADLVILRGTRALDTTRHRTGGPVQCIG